MMPIYKEQYLNTDYDIIDKNNLPNSPVQDNTLFNDGKCFFIEIKKHKYKCAICEIEVISMSDDINIDCLKPTSKYGVQLRNVLPPFYIRFGRFGKALINHIKSGAERRSDNEIKFIFNTFCLQCKLNIDGVCAKCGCNVNDKTDLLSLNKISWKTEKCPINKW